MRHGERDGRRSRRSRQGWGATLAGLLVMLALVLVPEAVAGSTPTCSASTWGQLVTCFEAGEDAQLTANINETSSTDPTLAAAVADQSLDLAGHTLTIDQGIAQVPGIEVDAGDGLDVSDSVGGGTLTVTGGEFAAGIGGSTSNPDAGTVTVTGDVVLDATGGSDGAGIGGASTSEQGGSGGTVTIEGSAQVTATGSAAAGIGGGSGNGSAGAGAGVTVAGSAQVTATGSAGAAGIGGGSALSTGTGGGGGSLTVEGTAQVTASSTTSSGGYGSGIGGGYGFSQGGVGATVEVEANATVTATGAEGGAGIGGGGSPNPGSGNGGAGGTLTVSGTATVTATAGIESAGVGGALGGGAGGAGATVTVEDDGTLQATGGCEGAAIGGGEGADASGGAGGSLDVSGGTVTATQSNGCEGESGAGVGGGYGGSDGGAGATVTVSGGTVQATGGPYAAGIGGGAAGNGAGGSSPSLAVTGGSVTATGGEDAPGVGTGYGATPTDFGGFSVSSGATLTASSTSGVAIGQGSVSAPQVGADWGTVSNAGTLVILAGSDPLDLPSGVTLQNSGELVIGDQLSGAGSVANTGVVALDGTLAGTLCAAGSPCVTNLSYPLSFDDNGVSGTVPPSQDVFADSFDAESADLTSPGSLTLPAGPTPADGVFEGWYSAASDGTQVTDATNLFDVFGDSSSTDSPETLYAHYLEVTTEPSPQSGQATEATSFGVMGSDDGTNGTVAYQWQVCSAGAGNCGAASGNWTNLSDSTTVSGATTDTLTLSDLQVAQSGLQFRAVLTNNLDSVDSDAATLTVGAAGQAITFNPLASPATANTTAPLVASGGGSGAPIVFSVDPATSPADACTVSGSTVTYLHVGTCVIDAN